LRRNPATIAVRQILLKRRFCGILPHRHVAASIDGISDAGLPLTLCLHNDEVMTIEADVLSSGCDPTGAVHDDNCVNLPLTDALAARHGEVFLQQSSTHPLAVATCHRCLKIGHHYAQLALTRSYTPDA
jgi:hypothetical protein